MGQFQVLDDGSESAEEAEQDKLPTHQTPLSRLDIYFLTLFKLKNQVKVNVKVKVNARQTTNTSNVFV